MTTTLIRGYQALQCVGYEPLTNHLATGFMTNMKTIQNVGACRTSPHNPAIDLIQARQPTRGPRYRRTQERYSPEPDL